MRLMWVGMTLIAAAAAGCGQGRAIFNVDVYSFLKGTGQDTVPYFVLPGIPTDTFSVPQRISLPGAGSSLVDSVRVRGTVDLRNQSGAGFVGFKLYLAADSAGTYLPGALALEVDSQAVAGVGTVQDSIKSDSLISGKSLFVQSQLWTRVVAHARDTDPVNPLQGKMVLTSLLLTVVVEDKVF